MSIDGILKEAISPEVTPTTTVGILEMKKAHRGIDRLECMRGTDGLYYVFCDRKTGEATYHVASGVAELIHDAMTNAFREFDERLSEM